jgi:hypothetical protein
LMMRALATESGRPRGEDVHHADPLHISDRDKQRRAEHEY